MSTTGCCACLPDVNLDIGKPKGIHLSKPQAIGVGIGVPLGFIALVGIVVFIFCFVKRRKLKGIKIQDDVNVKPKGIFGIFKKPKVESPHVEVKGKSPDLDIGIDIETGKPKIPPLQVELDATKEKLRLVEAEVEKWKLEFEKLKGIHLKEMEDLRASLSVKGDVPSGSAKGGILGHLHVPHINLPGIHVGAPDLKLNLHLPDLKLGVGCLPIKPELTDIDLAVIRPMFVWRNAVNGYLYIQILYSLAKLRIPDIVAKGPKLVKQIALEAHVNEEFLYRILHVAAKMWGIFKETAEFTFENTDLSLFLSESHHISIYNLVLLEGGVYYQAFGSFLETIKTGKPKASLSLGAPSFLDFYSSNLDFAVNFSIGSTNVSLVLSPLLTQYFDFGDVKTAVDIGGAQGSLILDILESHPNITEGINFELPFIIENNLKLPSRKIPPQKGRFIEIGGNFFADDVEIPKGKDLYILKNVLHEWDDELSLKILQNVKKAMTKNSRIFIIDAVLPKDDTHAALFCDIYFMHMTGGKERTEAQWRELLNKVALKIHKITHTKTIWDIIEVY